MRFAYPVDGEDDDLGDPSTSSSSSNASKSVVSNLLSLGLLLLLLAAFFRGEGISWEDSNTCSLLKEVFNVLSLLLPVVVVVGEAAVVMVVASSNGRDCRNEGSIMSSSF